MWPTAIELPVVAFTLGRVSVNWFEVSRSQGQSDLAAAWIMSFIKADSLSNIGCPLTSNRLILTLP